MNVYIGFTKQTEQIKNCKFYNRQEVVYLEDSMWVINKFEVVAFQLHCDWNSLGFIRFIVFIYTKKM